MAAQAMPDHVTALYGFATKVHQLCAVLRTAWQSQVARAAARSSGRVIIASLPESKSKTSQWAVSRRRVANPEKLGVRGPLVQRMYWRGSGGSDSSASGCF